jgi:hypothetical protein
VGRYTQRQDNNRRNAKKEVAFIDSYGGSTLNKSQAIINASKGEKFKGVMSPGAAPRPDPAASNRLAHVGMNGAPNVYEEKYQGRMKKRGMR